MIAVAILLNLTLIGCHCMAAAADCVLLGARATESEARIV
jgi:hypothetical protein